MSEDEEKVNLRRLEPAIQKFIKVAIPTDLERLRKHQINIEKVEWVSLTLKKSLCLHAGRCSAVANQTNVDRLGSF